MRSVLNFTPIIIFTLHPEQDLMGKSTVFFPLMEEYGNLDHDKRSGGPSSRARQHRGIDNEDIEEDKITSKGKTDLMEEEERNVGSVDFDVYKKYLKSAGGIAWAPVIICLLVLSQAAQGKTTCINSTYLFVDIMVQWEITCFWASGQPTASLALTKLITS